MKEKKIKKFDCCLMNPPYGTTGGDTIHLKFAEKCNLIADKNIVVMPFTFVTKLTNKVQNKFKESLSKTLISVDEVDSTIFKETHMPNVAVYDFDINKPTDSNITINYINGNSESLKSLSDKSNISDYEKQIFDILEKNGRQEIFGDCGRLNNWKEQIKKYNTKQEGLTDLVNKSLKKIKSKYIDDNFYALLVNRANGGMNGCFVSNNNGDIINGYNNLLGYFINKPLGIGYNALIFKTKKSAENCKIALQNPVLRLTCYRTQDDQNMVISKCYIYVPAIDWSDPRVTADEGLLEVCGCPKDKCKEYADYCKDIIDRADKGERP